MDNKEKTNFEHFCDFLIRTSYVLVFCLLIFLILGTFLDLDFIPRTSGLYSHSFIITCLVLIFVFVLSKKYESISIFKILELKKTLQESKLLNNHLEQKNARLLEHLVSITNTNVQTQKQGVINFNGGIIPDLSKWGMVEQVTAEEKEDRQKEEEKDFQEFEIKRKQRQYDISQRRHTEALVIDSILKDKSNAMKDVKFVSDKIIDPISKDIHVIFDGYYKTSDEEVFLDVMFCSQMLHLRFDRLYHILNKIYLYRQITNSNIYLRLVLLNFDEDDERIYVNKRRIMQFFDAAIQNGLLTVEIVGENETDFQQKFEFIKKEQ